MQQPKRILLIDDDPDHLLLCNIALRRRGHDVKVLQGCERPEELTDAVESFAPDIIFMDHDMRGVCGADLTRYLKSHTEYAQIPVIFFSGRDDIIQLAKDAGADGHFKKPFQFDSLIDITDKYLTQA